MVVFNNRVFTNQEGGVATASGTGSISASKNVFNNRFREAMTRGNVGDPHEVSQGVSRMSLPLQKLGVRLPLLKSPEENLTILILSGFK